MDKTENTIDLFSVFIVEEYCIQCYHEALTQALYF